MQVGLLSLVDHHPGEHSQADRIAQVVDEAVLAEELGFDSFWVGEHHFMDYICPNPVVLLSAIAARTSRIRIGTGVALAPHHDPVRLAEDYALVDVLSNGRLDLVVSRGTFKVGFDGFNQDMAERAARMREAVEIIRGCWTTDSFDYDGRFRTCRDLYVQPRPIQRPHPPMWLGCASDISASYAADAGLHLSIADFLGPGVDPKHLIEVYRSRLVETGRVAEHHLVSTGRHVFIGESEEEARRQFAPHYRNYVTMMGREARRAGSVDDPVVQGLASVESLPDELLLAGALCTDPDGAVRYLESLRDDLGLDHYWCYLDIGAQPDELVHRSMRLLADEVLPKVCA